MLHTAATKSGCDAELEACPLQLLLPDQVIVPPPVERAYTRALGRDMAYVPAFGQRSASRTDCDCSMATVSPKAHAEPAACIGSATTQFKLCTCSPCQSSSLPRASFGSCALPKRWMPMSKPCFIPFRQSRVPSSTLSLAVLPLAVEHATNNSHDAQS